MKVVKGGDTWQGGKAIAVDSRGVAHALVVRFDHEKDWDDGQTTLLLQPCVSPGKKK